MKVSSRASLVLLALCTAVHAQESVPRKEIYKTIGDTKLLAHVFSVPDARPRARSAIALFHGGGWRIGSPEWVYGDARRYAGMGLVAIAIEYRLSDEKAGITPVDAIDDACDAMRWIRANASRFGIDARHVAAYGVSAGGHLAASLNFRCAGKDRDAGPDALLLVSPAVDLANDRYFQGLLGLHAARDFSPDEQLTTPLPPTIVFSGTLDNLTPIAGARRYCERARAKRGDCVLHEYPGTGHLFTRKQPFDSATFDPDPVAWEDVVRNGDAFLVAHGFVSAERAP